MCSFDTQTLKQSHCYFGWGEKRMNINVRVISVLSFDGWVSAPQGIFGLGRHERLKGIRILADPGSLSVPWLGSSRLDLVPC